MTAEFTQQQKRLPTTGTALPSIGKVFLFKYFTSVTYNDNSTPPLLVAELVGVDNIDRTVISSHILCVFNSLFAAT
jgi:hypothetical protein